MSSNTIQLSYKNLLALGNKPRVHGNGFVQLDLNSNTRLHIWPEEKLETQKTPTPIHNHIYSISSQILLGRLLHTEYDVDILCPKPTHALYEAIVRHGSDTELRLIDDRCTMKKLCHYEMNRGSSYHFVAGRFHESSGVGLTATIMTRSAPIKHIHPWVACPLGQTPDNDFNRYQFEEKFLWSIILGVMNRLKGRIILVPSE